MRPLPPDLVETLARILAATLVDAVRRDDKAIEDKHAPACQGEARQRLERVNADGEFEYKAAAARSASQQR